MKNNILFDFIDNEKWSTTWIRYTTHFKSNKRQHLIDIIEECKKELEVMYENNEK